jgi:hypothetical protein
MKALEILNNFLKGNEVATISIKQKNWLIGQSKKESYKTENDGYNDFIYFDGFFCRIKQCKYICAGYGGTRGTQYTDKYKIEKLYRIKFNSTGLTAVYHLNDLTHFEKEGHSYTIIN